MESSSSKLSIDPLVERFNQLHRSTRQIAPVLTVLTIVLFFLSAMFPLALVALALAFYVAHLLRRAFSQALIGLGQPAIGRMDPDSLCEVTHQWLWDTRTESDILTYLAVNEPKLLTVRITLEISLAKKLFRRTSTPRLEAFLITLSEIPVPLPALALETLSTVRLTDANHHPN